MRNSLVNRLVDDFNRISRKTTLVLLFLVSMVILFISAQYNYFNTAEQAFFKNYQQDSEALVIGRLARSKDEGIFSDLGRLGGMRGKTFIPYNSQIGLQGMFFSALNGFLDNIGIEPIALRLNVLHATASFIFALTISSIITLLYLEIGLLASLILVSTIVLSQWLIVSGRNLYWVTGLMYAPMVAVFIAHKYEELAGAVNLRMLYIIVVILTFIKSAAGYEFISTLLIATTSPVIYFAVKNKWSLSRAIKRVGYIGIFGCLGFVIALSCHIIQLNIATGDVNEALRIVLDKIVLRTHGNPADFVNTPFYGSQMAGILEVVNIYWNGVAVSLESIGFHSFKIINFEDLVLIFLIATALAFLDGEMVPEFESARYKLFGLVGATWFSLLAPVSWYVLAKSHSHIHGHINHILWHMPFTIFGFALVGYVIALLAGNLIKTHKRVVPAAALLVIVGLCLTHIYKVDKSDDVIEGILKGNNLAEVHSKMGFDIFLKENGRLVYFKRDCSDVDLSRIFFLHILPSDVGDRIDPNIVFNTIEFDWRESSISTPLLSSYYNSCIAVRSLPNYDIKELRTGQLEGKKEFWLEHIHVKKAISPSEYIVAYNLSDYTWENGISRSRPGLFVENNPLNRSTLSVGDVLMFPFSGVRSILQLDYSDKYINIFVDGGKLDLIKDGYPHKILIILGKND